MGKDKPKLKVQPPRGSTIPVVKRGQLNGVFFILRIALLSFVVAVGWLNLKPYVAVVDTLFWGDGLTPIMQLVFSLPLIGWIASFLRDSWSWVLGALVWALFQIFEVMPLLLKNSHTMKQLIYGIGKHQKIKPRDGATELELHLIEAYNSKPQRWLVTAKVLAFGAYVLDFIVAFIHYPPIAGGIDGWRLWLAAPDFGSIDYANLALMGVVLFAFELAIWVACWIWEAKDLGVIPKSMGARS